MARARNENPQHMLGEPLLYSIWTKMKSRCRRTDDKDYRWYGGKGVSVCDEWVSYGGFHAWAVSNGYERGLSIDRVDSCGNYCPENCRWIPVRENIMRACADRKDRGGHKITREDASCIKRMVASGESTASLSGRFGISKSQIHLIVSGQRWHEAEPVGPVVSRPQRRRSVLIGMKGLTSDLRERISILLEIGDSVRTIADTLGVARSAVRKISKEQEVVT